MTIYEQSLDSILCKRMHIQKNSEDSVGAWEGLNPHTLYPPPPSGTPLT